jgi:hypothetical protein
MVDRTGIPRQILELNSKGKRPMGRPRTRWFSQILEDMEKQEKSWPRNEEDKTVGRQKKLETFYPSTCIKWKQC